MKAWIALVSGCSLLIACDRGTETQAPQPRKMEIANPYQDRLIALSPANRRLALRRAIQDAGQSCKRIVGSAYQGPYKGQHQWVGRCEPGGDWAVFLAPNGDVQVRSCADVKALELPECISVEDVVKS